MSPASFLLLKRLLINWPYLSYSAHESPVGTVIKFNPPTGTDKVKKRRGEICIRTKFQCLSAMREYKNKSLEELRLEDYVAGRKGRRFTISSFENVLASFVAEQNKFGTPENILLSSTNTCTFPSGAPLANSSATTSTTSSFGRPRPKAASCWSRKKSPVPVVGKADTDWTSMPPKYTWTIKELAEKSGFYRVGSPTFIFGLSEFRMLLYLGGDLPEDTTHDMPDIKNLSSVFGSVSLSNDRSVEAFSADIILAIEMVRTCGLILEKHWKLSVKLNDQTLLKSFRFSMNYKLGWKVRYFVLPYELAQQILSDNCSVICELSLEPGVEPIAKPPTSQMELTSGMNELSCDLRQLLLSAEASDATMRVKGRDFPVHRCILAARTPVFSSMFRHQMSESEMGLVNIEDCEPDTFERFLQYVYSGKVEDLKPQNASALYEVADKYQVKGLKSYCLACIIDGLSVQSLCDAVALATRYDETELMRLAVDFFAFNIKDVILSAEWKAFLAENPTQANELLVRAHHPDQK